MSLTRWRRLVTGRWQSLVPGLLAVGLMLVWAVDNGGFDSNTWYWGALLLLSALAVVVVRGSMERRRMRRASVVAGTAFAAYVIWSYASIAWAQAPGTALTGSGRTLLYFICFALMAAIPWRPETAWFALTAFAVGVGAIAIFVLLRLASADQVGTLVVHGRLQSPTGYFNSNAALFTMGTLVSTALAARRELPGLLRGVLIAGACGSLQLAVLAQSRGWLFTLPVVLMVTVSFVNQRLRFVTAAMLPAVAAVISLHKLLALFNASASPSALDAASRSAGEAALVLCTAMLVVGTVVAWVDRLFGPWAVSRQRRRQLGLAASVAVLAAGSVGAAAVTHGNPASFIQRQWTGFSHPTAQAAHGSYFETVGSGRYDFWRVALSAFAAHPVAGLGQDNFEDFYLLHRRTGEEPRWTHSLEIRLLAHTGLVGFALFAVFLGAAVIAALSSRRRDQEPFAAVAGIALVPLAVWLVHGSLDWFWEMPALTAPALGFLGIACRVSASTPLQNPRPGARPRYRWLAAAAGSAALLSATFVLAPPYVSVRLISIAAASSARDPQAALRDYALAAEWNPLSPDPGLQGGLLALSLGENTQARNRFAQSISRERGAWLAWLGKGLSESALNRRAQAAHALRIALSINDQQPPIRIALQRLYSRHPLAYAETLPLFKIVR